MRVVSALPATESNLPGRNSIRAQLPHARNCTLFTRFWPHAPQNEIWLESVRPRFKTTSRPVSLTSGSLL